MITADNLLQEISRQEIAHVERSPQNLLEQLVKDIATEDDETAVDILTYVRAEWGLNENPYPIQRFILKLIFGLPLDDRPDDIISTLIAPNIFKSPRASQFNRHSFLDIGPNRACRVKSVDPLHNTITLENPPPNPLKPGMEVTGRIVTWDRFRENITGTFTESEFFDFLYADGPGTDQCRISISRDEYKARIGKQMNLVLLRIGRRGTKTSISQWVAGYFAYRILKYYHPQAYFRVRRDQPISMTLVATSKDQAQDLLAPARAAIKRSPYLKRFVTDDASRRMTLNTPYNIDHGLDSESGIKMMAAPCSAKATKGYANILVLLEEYGLYFYQLQKEGSNKSDKEIYNAVSPSIADLQNPVTGDPEGLIFIISTPMTREAHMFELENQIWDNKAEFQNALVLHLPSYWTNPLLTTQQLKQDYATDPISFRREYEAYYTDQRQQAFGKDELELCRSDPDGTQMWIAPGEDVFMGFDLGLKNDPTSISLVGVNAQGRARLLLQEVIAAPIPGVREGNPEYTDPENPLVLDIRKIAKRVDELWDFWGCREGAGDQWNAYGLHSHLKSSARDNLDLMEVNATLNDRIARNFIAYINQKQLTIYATIDFWEDKQGLLRELLRLQRVEAGSMTKRLKLEAPQIKGAHDDQYSSLSRALFVAQKAIGERPPVNLSSPAMATRANLIRSRAEVLRAQKLAAATTMRPSARSRRAR
jgi:hypothetical protein